MMRIVAGQRPGDDEMSTTARGFAIAGVTAVFGVIGTLLGNLFGAPTMWAATAGVIGAALGVHIFLKDHKR
jgi:uncharacterized membrane protein YoaK (UPF0700 family)